jgi:hypothetical protein
VTLLSRQLITVLVWCVSAALGATSCAQAGACSNDAECAAGSVCRENVCNAAVAEGEGDASEGEGDGGEGEEGEGEEGEGEEGEGEEGEGEGEGEPGICGDGFIDPPAETCDFGAEGVTGCTSCREAVGYDCGVASCWPAFPAGKVDLRVRGAVEDPAALGAEPLGPVVCSADETVTLGPLLAAGELCGEPVGIVQIAQPPGAPPLILLLMTELTVAVDADVRFDGGFVPVLVVYGGATVAGTIDVSAALERAGAGAASGAQCGARTPATPASITVWGGGGGGGAGPAAAGGAGGAAEGDGDGAGAPGTPAIPAALIGGCAGASGAFALLDEGECDSDTDLAPGLGGGGGGALALLVAGTLTINGSLLAGGGGGGGGGDGCGQRGSGGGGGGGSGGLVLVEFVAGPGLDDLVALADVGGGGGGGGGGDDDGDEPSFPGDGARAGGAGGDGGGGTFNDDDGGDGGSGGTAVAPAGAEGEHGPLGGGGGGGGAAGVLTAHVLGPD